MSSEAQKHRTGRGVAVGIAVFLVLQFGAALWRLTHSGGMDNKFSRIAIEDHRGYVISQNLHALLAYALIGLAGWLVVMPVATFLRRRLRRKIPAAVIGFGGAFLLHGYFMFRLAHARPYFTGDASFGDWYYGILRLPPEPWQTWVNGFIFDTLPIIGLFAVTLWWFIRFRPAGRLIFGGLMLLLAILGFVEQHGFTGSAMVSENSGTKPLNVIFIGSDSLRGDRLGYAGYRPGRTDGPAADGVSPNIDRWAADAVVFDACRTPIGSTLESGVSLMTSSYPHTHGLRQMFASRDQIEGLDRKTTALAEILREHGYETAAIGDWCAGYYQLTPLGFDEIDVSSFDSFRIYVSQVVLMAHFVVPLYFDNELGSRLFPQIRSFAQFVTPEVVTERVEKKIQRQAMSGRPFFWHVFYSCNHLPYRSAEPYNRMFSDPDYAGPNTTGVDFDIDAFIGGTDVETKWSALPEKEVRQIRALFDGCTRQFDTNFGRVIRSLDEHGLLDHTIVVLVSDHGDDLYGPGLTLGHGLSFNGADPSYHVPLAIRVPDRPAHRFHEPVRTLDVAPTITGLLGIETPDEWEGRDLGPWLRNPAKASPLPFYGETQFPFIQFRVPGIERPQLPPMDGLTEVDADFNHQFVLRPDFRDLVIDSKQRCLRTRDWKVVCTPTVSGGRHFQLFHTATDPHCRRDLAAERPEVIEPMKRALNAWIDDRVETLIPEIFPDGEPAGSDPQH
ncbi:sulfatase [Haloferula sp. A504]|uniref:sulfatase n=1 Tax=Haloferula sp. A504 TaxID=3373601 RepID=UPI0031CAF268|nr:sulfatase [Verrucomicrobiaceae bacterium E54]